MRPKIQRLALLGMLMGALMSTGLMAPEQAAARRRSVGTRGSAARARTRPWGSTTIRG